MKEFIAKCGYMIAWAFGTPKYTFKEGFEQYYRFGLSVMIISAILVITGIIGIIISIKELENDNK